MQTQRSREQLIPGLLLRSMVLQSPDVQGVASRSKIDACFVLMNIEDACKILPEKLTRSWRTHEDHLALIKSENFYFCVFRNL